MWDKVVRWFIYFFTLFCRAAYAVHYLQDPFNAVVQFDELFSAQEAVLQVKEVQGILQEQIEKQERLVKQIESYKDALEVYLSNPKEEDPELLEQFVESANCALVLIEELDLHHLFSPNFLEELNALGSLSSME